MKEGITACKSTVSSLRTMFTLHILNGGPLSSYFTSAPRFAKKRVGKGCGIINKMLRVKKICTIFNDFVAKRTILNASQDRQYILRRGIENNEIANLWEYFKSVTHENITRGDFEDELKDATAKLFFETGQFQIANEGRLSLFCLGWKGRALLKGPWYKRYANFIEFTLEERSEFYAYVLGFITSTAVWVVIKTAFYLIENLNI